MIWQAARAQHLAHSAHTCRDGIDAHFTPQERVEVTIVATAMGMLNKCNDALRVPLESEMEALVS